ncbi:hypothetical protein R6Q57_024056 [Mikania cordata]
MIFGVVKPGSFDYQSFKEDVTFVQVCEELSAFWLLKAGKSPEELTSRDKVVDFHWIVYDPWTVVSVSDDVETTSGGGTLQIWRMSDLIYKPRDEVLTKLEDFKAHVASCGPKT